MDKITEEEIETESENEYDTEKIDLILKEGKEYLKNGNGIKKVFKFVNPNGEINKENSTKYISEIDSNSVKYIGYLTEDLFKEYFGYYKYENNDEYLGEWKDDIKENKGIYLYYNEKENNIEEFYLGEWKNGKRNGKGIYFWKNSNEEMNINNSDYDVVIGNFNDNDFLEGISVTKNKEKYLIYKGKYENCKKNDENAFFLENFNKGFYGKFINDEIISGRSIYFKNVLDGDFTIENSFYFEKDNDDKYKFDFKKNVEFDSIIEKECKNILKYKFENNLPPIYNFIKEFISKSSNLNNFEGIKIKEDILEKLSHFLKIDN
jgi:hypothetical protein